jgi:hypothetical protein
MTTYTIEDDIPLPPCDSRGRGGSPRKPQTQWTQMLDVLAPGQSMLTGDHREAKAADQFKVRRPEKKFTIRKIAGQGWRVWRLE